jgi:hypothetical protein
MPKTVWVRRITHRHGCDIEVHATEGSANLSLLEYVDFNWEHEMDDTPRPSDNDAAIKMYFDTVENEFFDIDSHEVIE